MKEHVITPGEPPPSKDPTPADPGMSGELLAECPCGFRRSSIAVGLLDGGKVCSLPALCPRCGRLYVANYLAANPSCPQCRKPLYFYTEPGMRQECPLPVRQGPVPVERAGGQGPGSAADGSIPDLLRLRLGAGSAQELRLPNVAYICPSCGRKTMTFRRAGAQGPTG